MNEQLKVLQDSGVISEMETRDAQDDDNTQIADIDYFIAEGECDGFIISPNSTAALTPAVERACETGKPVVVFDRGVETDCATTFIHPIGGFAWGIDSANFLVDNLQEGDKVVALRILQGIGVGGEYGGAVLLAVEFAPAERRGFFGSFAHIGVPGGLFLASGAFALASRLPDEAFLAWGWRACWLTVCWS